MKRFWSRHYRVQEARRSSEIENIVTTNAELYRAMVSNKIQMTPATKEVLRYREALWEGVSSLRTRPSFKRAALRADLLAYS